MRMKSPETMPCKRDPRPLYVYLAGVEHSGSTLVACLLGAHPEISCVGEFSSDFSQTGRCSCGQVYQDCEFWQEWGERARAAGIPFRIGRLDVNLMPGPEAGFRDLLYFHMFPSRAVNAMRDVIFAASRRHRRMWRQAIDQTRVLVRELLAMEGTRTFLDTSKNAMQVRFLVRQAEYQIKMVHLIRDGRGVMNSLMRKENYSRDQAVGAWLWGNRTAERVKSCLPRASVLELRLEDLCREPADTLERLLRFCEVESRPKIDYSDKRARHIVGNGMRHSFNGEIRLDERWREGLTAEDLACFEKRAGIVNRRYGYGDGPRE